MVALVELTIHRHPAGQDAAAERAVRNHPDVVPPAERQDIGLDRPIEHVVLRLVGHDPPVLHAFLYLVHAVVADAYRPDLALFLKFHERRHRIGDGRAADVRPVALVEVDHVRPQSAKTVLAFPRDAVRLEVPADAEPLVLDVLVAAGPVAPDEPALGREDDLVPDAFERPADEFLGPALAVDGRGVHEVDAELDGPAYGGHGLRVLRPAPEPAADGPGAEADDRHLEPGITQLSPFHVRLLLS